MRHSSMLRGRPSSASLLLVFLLVILAISLGLGYHAFATARSHRETVESALGDYASMAAWQFSRLARENLNAVLSEVFDDVARRTRGRTLSSPSVVAREMYFAMRMQGCECRGLRNPQAYFRVDLSDSSVVSLPDTVSDSVLRRIADTVLTHRAADARRRFGLIAAPAGALLESATVVAYGASYSRGGPARAVYGFVADAGALGELFRRWYDTRPLLPPAIAAAQPNDSLLYVTVRAPGGGRIFESPILYPMRYAARDTVGRQYGDLFVEAAVRPDAAAHLMIGGLPRSRLPLILGLLLVTLGVGTAALFQIRREHQLARLRDDFVSGVSHELRTPLAQIRMFAELLDDGKLRTDSERKRSINVINREARRLTHLVENVLQFSRLRRAPLGRAVEETDVETTVGEVIEAFRPLARALDVRVRMEVENNLVVLADRDAVKQMLLNLLDNAVKYGPRGQTVTIGVARAGDNVRLTVEDEGPGVPPGDRRRIWQPYHRLVSRANGTAGGTGIGLAVVDKLASLHHGRAWVEDASGRGARFVVELPAAQVESGPEPLEGGT